MEIAIVGAGAIGSTFAFHLAKAGHAVTVVARGARLAWLESERAIVRTSGERAAVTVAPALDPATAYDLVLVTVLQPQVDAVLPALKASAARAVMFMFNTFDPISPLSEAVGAERFVFGFPGGVFTLLVDGKIRDSVNAGTTVGDAKWAAVFTEAGIPTTTDDDMHAWLRSHAALVAPLMAIGVKVAERGAGVTWAEAGAHADALHAGLYLVRKLGHVLRPTMVRIIAGMPGATFLLWTMSRTKMLRELGSLGPAESRMLIDQMAKASPSEAAPLVAIRP